MIKINKGRWLIILMTLVFSVPSYSADSTIAPDVAGNYSCDGYDAFYGLKYSGPLLIKKSSSGYEFAWNFGASGGRYSGTALYNPKEQIIAVMFANPDDPKEMGVGIYNVNPNGTLSGNWLYENRDRISNELCIRTDK